MNRFFFKSLFFFFLSSRLFAVEEISSSKIQKGDIYLFYNYKMVENSGLTNYSQKIFINGWESLMGIEQRKSFVLNFIGVGYRKNVSENTSLDFSYKTLSNPVEVNSFSSVVYNSPWALNMNIGDGHKSEISSFYSLYIGYIHFYKLGVKTKLIVGASAVRNSASVDLASLGQRLNEIFYSGLFKVGAEYDIYKNMKCEVSINAESFSKIKFNNFSQKVYPIYFEVSFSGLF